MSTIKHCFISRWGDDGVIMEADYSQLEVIVLAHESGDRQLQADILAGVDQHSMSASQMYQLPYEEIREGYLRGDKKYVKMRKLAKGPSFLLAYGGQPKAMAAKFRVDLSLCETFVENYYKRYPGVKAWQERNINQVNYSACHKGSTTAKGEPARTGTLVSGTARRYVFTEEDGFRGRPNFRPTRIKNYPIQGMAGGDIVLPTVGLLRRRLKCSPLLRNTALLINTVHDSVILDVHKDVLDTAKDLVHTTLELAPTLLKSRFNIDFKLPLKVDVDVAPTWGDIE